MYSSMLFVSQWLGIAMGVRSPDSAAACCSCAAESYAGQHLRQQLDHCLMATVTPAMG